MVFDEPVLSHDRYGHEVVIIRKQHLQNFCDLIAWLRKRGYNTIVKLRLHSDDRQDRQCLELILELMAKKFEEKVYKRGCVKYRYAYSPDVQYCFKASFQHDVYRYVKSECTAEKRCEFLKKSTNISTYDSSIQTCCTRTLQSDGPSGVRKHCFDVLRQTSPYTDELKEKDEQWNKVQNNVRTYFCRDVQQGPPVIYGAGIQLDPAVPITICDNFSLCNLDTILNLMEERYDGISYPYLYCGTEHSLFPWHIEDNGLFSLSYLFGGNPKLWFAIPPMWFGLVDHISHGFAMDLGNTACRAVLADHKIVVADPEYYKENHGVPFDEIVQEEGDFIITMPFALHSGFNLGDNLAMAVNFADDDWIEWGMYPAVCDCNEYHVQLNLTNILKERRPDLLEKYLCETSSAFPRGHPREVRWCQPTSAAEANDKRQLVLNQDRNCSILPSVFACLVGHEASNQDNDSDVPSISIPTAGQGLVVQEQQTGPSVGPGRVVKFKERTLHCPKCHQSYQGNKIKRLTDHIIRFHSTDAESLLNLVSEMYKKWKPKSDDGHYCRVCGIFRRGTITHIRHHHFKVHADLPFEGAVKSKSA